MVKMKKQVTFAQSQTVHQLQQHRFSLPTESKLAAHDVFTSDQRLYRRHSTPSDHRATVYIPRSMASAPFLKHSVLTPAQRQYLYTVAASYSGERVRDIITTHYLNILHRCIRAGHTVEDHMVSAPVILPETVDSSQTQATSKPTTNNKQSQNKQTNSKQRGKTLRNSGKTTLPKIPKRQPRLVRTPASQQRKKLATPPKTPKQSKKSPLLSIEKEDEDIFDDLSLDDSLSDCLSSLSITDWDPDLDSISDSDS